MQQRCKKKENCLKKLYCFQHEALIFEGEILSRKKYEPIQVKVFSRFLGLFERKFAKNPQKSDETVLLG
jgi:hypothetical protein